MRLNKFISDAGFCSRREADRLIENGEVFVNGTKAFMGIQVVENDEVIINGKKLTPGNKEDKIIYAFYKPVGVVSTMAKDDQASIYNFLKKTVIIIIFISHTISNFCFYIFSYLPFKGFNNTINAFVI